jgi:hypothetical protein
MRFLHYHIPTRRCLAYHSSWHSLEISFKTHLYMARHSYMYMYIRTCDPSLASLHSQSAASDQVLWYRSTSQAANDTRIKITPPTPSLLSSWCLSSVQSYDGHLDIQRVRYVLRFKAQEPSMTRSIYLASLILLH